MHSTDTTSCPPALVLDLNRLEELRKAHGIESDTDLARVIGVAPSTLFRVRTRRTTPNNDFMTKVRLAFPAASLDSLFVLNTSLPATARIAA